MVCSTPILSPFSAPPEPESTEWLPVPDAIAVQIATAMAVRKNVRSSIAARQKARTTIELLAGELVRRLFAISPDDPTLTVEFRQEPGRGPFSAIRVVNRS